MKAVNLLPTDLRGPAVRGTDATSPEGKGGAGPFVVLGVLAALVAGTAGALLSGNAIAARQSELAAVTAQQQAVQGQISKLKSYADFQSLSESRTATVKDLAGRRFDWEQAMRDLSRAIPADVTLSSLVGDLGAGGGGAGGSSIRSSIASPAIELQGCTKDQRAVAVLMSRLGDVDGVTRVSLAKSAESTTSSTNASTTAAGPCGFGTSSTFDVVAFFQDATASVAAPGTSSTATASAAGTAPATPAASGTPAASATPASGTTTASAGGTKP
jgi:Tfp pilus assembly protein PilN